MEATPYTLFIVESPTLAHIIDEFRLPGIEVLATGGFSWQPQWDAKTQELKPKADPAWRSFRKRLKQKAPWASQIIVATDPDPAGSFISYSILRFLKTVSIRRTYIRTLSPAGIKQAISQSSPLGTDGNGQDEYYSLRNRYLILQTLNEKLRRIVGANQWAKIVLFSLFTEKFPSTRLAGLHGTVHQLVAPVECHHNTEVVIKKLPGKHHDNLRKIYRPLNTSALLELVHSGEGRLEHYQKSLNKLFTTIPAELGTGLISYPRTGEIGYYPETWDLAFRNWIKHNDVETFLPEVLRDILYDQSPHESLRPLDPGIGPDIARPLIRKNLYDIYAVIYDHYVKSITMRNLKKACKVIIRAGVKNFETELVGCTSETNFRTMITISDLLNSMNTYGAVRPSGFGKLFDALISEGWITSSEIFVSPGPAFYSTTLSGTFTWRSWLENLIQLMNNPAIEVSKLKCTLDRMIQELPL